MLTFPCEFWDVQEERGFLCIILCGTGEILRLPSRAAAIAMQDPGV